MNREYLRRVGVPTLAAAVSFVGGTMLASVLGRFDLGPAPLVAWIAGLFVMGYFIHVAEANRTRLRREAERPANDA